jgi:hypothetical protein
MSVPLIPWEPHVFPAAIQAELRRRSVNRGLVPIDVSKATWDNNADDVDDWHSHRGPMTAWVRVCSNGYGIEHEISSDDMPGFILYGGQDYYTSYGINPYVLGGPDGLDPNQQILGYTPSGLAHVIDNNLTNEYPVRVPNPHIESIQATIQKELLRRVEIKWTCFSFKQLEYMTPYFLVPGISIVVEWGWNHFNPMSLLDLSNVNQLCKYFNNPYPLYTENVLGSKGNYEVVFGIVTNFKWSIDGNKIRCITEVTSKDRLWAGQVINANMVERDPAGTNDKNESGVDKDIRVVDSLKQFVENYIDQFKELVDQSRDPDKIIDSFLDNPTAEKKNLQAFVRYVKDRHPNNYKDYLLGVFFGRDEKNQELIDGQKSRPTEGDFDENSQRSHFWINMGLIVEIINFHSSELKAVRDQPMFRVDVDDCVISAHPNLISTNGDVLLIPNAIAPKYHSGGYGYQTSTPELGIIETAKNAVAGLVDILLTTEVGANVIMGRNVNQVKEMIDNESNRDEYSVKMLPTSEPTPFVKATDLKPEEVNISRKWADYRLQKILSPLGMVRRDDISKIINMNRNSLGGKYDFPFLTTHTETVGGVVRSYEYFFTGFFKDLYFNAKAFKDIVKDQSITNYKQVYEEIFRQINKSASEFWNFKLVGATGKDVSELATMKVVDENLSQYTSNDGEIYTFDYNSGDGILQGVDFNPMLSNAQAIRTIYTQTNLTSKRDVVLNDTAQLLDYQFRDRLFKADDQQRNSVKPETFNNGTFKASMKKLQAIKPLPNAFQVTAKKRNGQEVIFRLAIPPENADLLTLMINDNDKVHNPRYLGIMPGIQAQFTLQGIAGIRTFAMFKVRGLPEPYSENNVVFRVINVNDQIQHGSWITTIVAGVLPLRPYFQSKLSPRVRETRRNFEG